MKSYDYEAVTHDGDIYCTGCLPEGVSINDEEVSPIFAGSEWDYIPDCCVCGCEHDYVSLTQEGLDRIAAQESEEDAARESILRDFLNGNLTAAQDKARYWSHMELLNHLRHNGYEVGAANAIADYLRGTGSYQDAADALKGGAI